MTRNRNPNHRALLMRDIRKEQSKLERKKEVDFDDTIKFCTLANKSLACSRRATIISETDHRVKHMPKPK